MKNISLDFHVRKFGVKQYCSLNVVLMHNFSLLLPFKFSLFPFSFLHFCVSNAEFHPLQTAIPAHSTVQMRAIFTFDEQMQHFSCIRIMRHCITVPFTFSTVSSPSFLLLTKFRFLEHPVHVSDRRHQLQQCNSAFPTHSSLQEQFSSNALRNSTSGMISPFHQFSGTER